MSAPSGWVLLAAALLTSPALYAGLVAGTMPLDVTLTRFLLATAGCWVAFAITAPLIWPAPPSDALPGAAPLELADTAE